MRSPLTRFTVKNNARCIYSSAFDKVHYGKLFKLLIKRKLPLLIVSLLFNCYAHQQVCVSWESYKYRYFDVAKR